MTKRYGISRAASQRRRFRDQSGQSPRRIQLAVVGASVVKDSTAGVNFDAIVVSHPIIAAEVHLDTVFEYGISLVTQLFQKHDIRVLHAKRKVQMVIVA